MITPIILYLALAITTAFIARWSDNLGKKLGKKRVSIFGLRPRDTAATLTILSSLLIMTVSLGGLLAVNAPLRNALLYYDQERAKYRSDISGAQIKLNGTQHRLDETKAQLSEISENLRETSERVIGAQDAARTAEGARNKAQENARLAQQREGKAREQERAASRGEKAAEQLARHARQDLVSSRLALRDSEARLGSTENRLQQINSDLSSAQKNLKVAQANFKVANASAKTAGAAAFRAGQAAFKAGKDALAAETEVHKARHQVALLNQQSETLKKEASDYELASNLFSVNDALVKVDQVFAARIVPPGQSPKEVSETLHEMFQSGQEAFLQDPQYVAAVAKGAKLQLYALPEIEGNQAVYLGGEQLFERLGKAIAASGAANSVRLVALRNFLENESPISVRFIVVPVAIAFREGDELASTTIDGNAGDAGVFHDLKTLTDKGREVAIQRKVNPPLSPDEPNFYASGTNVALFEAFRRIEAAGGTSRVRLLAAEDLTTVEPLKVRFEVEPSQPAS